MWYFTLHWICTRLDRSIVVYERVSAAITFSAYIALDVLVASAVISDVGLFQTWDKNRKEEERIPVLEFDGFSFVEGTTILIPPLAGWIATTLPTGDKNK
jgi:hypothetical protein